MSDPSLQTSSPVGPVVHSKPSPWRWRRVKAWIKLMWRIFFVYPAKLAKEKPVRFLLVFNLRKLYNMLFIFSFGFFIYTAISHPHYFGLGKNFPEKSDLSEISGTLRFVSPSGRGKVDFYRIEVDDETKDLYCQTGAGFFSAYDCRGVFSREEGQAVVRYTPEWGLIEVEYENHTLSSINYENSLRIVKKIESEKKPWMWVSLLAAILLAWGNLSMYKDRDVYGPMPTKKQGRKT